MTRTTMKVLGRLMLYEPKVLQSTSCVGGGDSASSTDEMTAEERREQQKKKEALHASSLRIPRRPPWNAKMSVEGLDDNERRAFLEWRSSLARLAENENLVLTPFEKNLDIWGQLWRVLEHSDLPAA